IIFTIFCTFLLCFHNLEAGHPYSLKWKSIDTENFQIIYNPDIEEDAQRVANLAEHYLKHHNKTMKSDWRRTTIVLISESAEANGSVFYAPYKSHFYNTPGQFAANEWFTALSVHEIRHMSQLNTINSGGRKITWYVFGDIGAAIYAVAFVPSWIMEGDAVLAETTLTNGGRGRQPSFDMFVRTNELSNRREDRYSYYRSYMGSYNDNYPIANHYVLGYHMTTYGRREYGSMLWNDTFKDMGGNIIRFDHFNYSLTRNTGDKTNINKLYQKTYDDLRQKWQEQLEGLEFTESRQLTNVKSRRWTSLTQIGEYNGHLYAIQVGQDSLSGIVDISGKSPVFLKQISSGPAFSGARNNERTVSFGGGKAVWTDLLPDARWDYRSFSSINVYDLKSKKSQRLFPKGKFISATISRDGKKIAAVEFNSRRECSLVIIDSASKKIILRKDSPDNSFLFDPSWFDNGENIAVCSLDDRGTSLLNFNANTGTFSTVIDYTHDENITTPYPSGNYIFYQSDYSGINNIYAVDLNSTKRYQVVSARYGAFLPSVNQAGDTLYYSDYTVKGHQAKSLEIDPTKWTPLENTVVKRIDYFKPVIDQEAGKSIAEDVPQKDYASKDYSPALNSINIYSWSPIGDYGLGLVLYSVDVLETTSTELGYHYNYNEKTSSVRGNLEYRGYYPIFGIGGIYGDRSKSLDDSWTKNIVWRESTGYGYVYLPLNLSRGIHTTYFELRTDAQYTEISDKSHTENNLRTIDDGQLTSVSYSALFSHSTQGMLLDIYPRWGQLLMANFRHTPQGDYFGEQISLFSKLYFPSIFKHHSLYFEGAYQFDRYKYGEDNNYRYQLSFLYPRGYDELFFEKFYKGSINYTLPLLNTNFNIWRMFYIKRIKLNGFYDHGYGTYQSNSFYSRSAGSELVLEYHPFSNKHIVLDTGIRYAHLIESRENVYELVFRLSNE
ncbi:MAG TPA: hypothetical protein P5123_05545, partial [Spirochaetota bacterium]|nr:hypothetical protein [Spirochaetota bacterium]